MERTVKSLNPRTVDAVIKCVREIWDSLSMEMLNLPSDQSYSSLAPVLMHHRDGVHLFRSLFSLLDRTAKRIVPNDGVGSCDS